jgi:L-2-hydroxyglutarate oxidase LhgO
LAAVVLSKTGTFKMDILDVTIIGAGVVGLAVAARLADEKKDIIVLEKEHSFGQETSSRHSGVIHSGIYYPPDSLKSNLCVEGNKRLYEICRKYNIAHKQIGKLIVAADDSEVKELETFYQRGVRNGNTSLDLVSGNELEILEPNVRAVAAIRSPDTGIIDSHGLMQFYIAQSKSKGVAFVYQAKVTCIEKCNEGFQLKVEDVSGDFSFITRVLINCGGLYADKVAEMAGIDIDKAGYRIHFCKGEYYSVGHGKNKLVQSLIYPVPSADLTGLGIHITLDLGGRMRLGPSAYYIDNLDYSMDTRYKSLFYQSAKAYLPALEYEDIEPDMAGIRPKVQGPGDNFRDFIIQEESGRGLPGLVNLIGIESPGLTCSPAIAEYVAKICC